MSFSNKITRYFTPTPVSPYSARPDYLVIANSDLWEAWPDTCSAGERPKHVHQAGWRWYRVGVSPRKAREER